MDTAKYWIDHYAPADPKLIDLFLSLNSNDCNGILNDIDKPISQGVSFESAENRVFGFDDVVVKFYRPGRYSFEALSEELIFLEDLREADVPFVRPIGKLGNWQGLYYLIFEKVEKPYIDNRRVLDEASVRKMVHLTAKIHEVGAKRDAPARPLFDPKGMTEGGFEVILKAGFLPDSLKKRYKEATEEIAKKFELLGPIPVQRIHGDTYSGNIIWRENNPIFLDLDDFQVAPVALDVRLLSFPWRLDSLPESMNKKERRKIQHEMVLDMYREVRSFPKEWEKFFPLLGLYRDIQFDAWFSARWNEKGFASNYEDDDLTDLEWWKDSLEWLEESLKND